MNQGDAEALPGISSCPIASCYMLKATPQGVQTGDGALALSSDDYRYHNSNDDTDFDDIGENTWN